jgi:hypothetical protein
MSNSAFEFGQKIAAATKSAAGLGSVGHAVGNTIGGLFKSPARAGQEAMMAARTELRTPASSPHYPYAPLPVPQGKLRNPNYDKQLSAELAAGKARGEKHDTTWFGAQQHIPQYIPRRDALQQVGQNAARAQALDQAAAVGGGAAVAGSAAGSGGK